jgi:DNA-directed RNA polymerase specialized sigma24 family protein
MTDLEHLAQLINETTAARGVDRYAVDVCGVSATEWAKMTGRNRVTVQRNLKRAREQTAD